MTARPGTPQAIREKNGEERAEETKACRKCGEVKPVADFPENRKLRDGRSSWCRSCQSATTQD
jgi:hypothetical protein